jgi:hypothetical protein
MLAPTFPTVKFAYCAAVRSKLKARPPHKTKNYRRFGLSADNLALNYK